VNFAGLIYGNTQPSFAVEIRPQILGEPIQILQDRQYSVISSTVTLWGSGAKPLAILLFLFAIVWPYVKLVCMLYCLLMPPKILPVKRRGTIIHVLDAYGKYSFVEFYFVSYLLTILTLSVENPGLTGVDVRGALYSLNTSAVSLPSLSVFLGALILSLALSNIMLRLHCCCIVDDAKIGEDNSRASLYSNAVEMRGTFAKRTLIASAACTVVAGVFVVLAWAFPHLKTGKHGIARLFFTLQGDSLSEDVGLVSLVQVLVASGSSGESFLAFFLVFTLCIMPVVSIVYHLWFIFAPVSKEQTIYFNDIRLLISSWSALDVFVVASVFTTLELEHMTKGLSKECEDYGSTASNFLVSLGLFESADTDCFRISATLQIGVYFSLFAGLSLGVRNALIRPIVDVHAGNPNPNP
jgi:hypothetical protein